MPVINDRRDFIRKPGLAGMPLLLPYADLHAASALPAGNSTAEQEDFMVNFAMDGLFFSPAWKKAHDK